MRGINRSIALSIGLASLSLSGCSMSPYGVGGDPTLRIVIDGFRSPEQVIQRMSAPLPSLGPETIGVQSTGSPQTVDGFHCLAVNVMGPGIANSSGNDDPAATLARVYAGESCAYPGITSRSLSLASGSASVDLTIPSGPGRVVQVLGVRDPRGQYCGRGLTIAEADAISGGKLDIAPFEAGRAVFDLYQPKAVGIANEYSNKTYKQRASRLVTCGGGSGSDKSPLEVSTQGLLGWWSADSFEDQYPEPGSGVELAAGVAWKSARSNIGFDLPSVTSENLHYENRETGGLQHRGLRVATPLGTSGVFSNLGSPRSDGTSSALTIVAFGKPLGPDNYLLKVNLPSAPQGAYLGKDAGANVVFFAREANGKLFNLSTSAPSQPTVFIGRAEIVAGSLAGALDCLKNDGTRCARETASPSPGATGFDLSSWYVNVGSGSSTGSPLGTEFFEMLVFKRYLSDSEVERLYDYFRLKYGIPYIP